MVRMILALALCFQLLTGGLAQSPTSAQKPDEQKPAPNEPRQQAPDDTDVVKITTNLVQVDAVITDSKGNVVTDLRQDEVEIFEDGKSRQITNFAFVPLDSPTTEANRTSAKPSDKNAPPVPPRQLRPEEVKRTIAVVVDDLGLSAESAHFVRQALKKFIERDLQPYDLVAIVRTGGGMGALQQFTSDKRQLLAAADKIRWNPNGRGGLSAFAPLTTDPLAVALDRNQPNPSGGDVDRSRSDNLEGLREDLFTVGTLGALNYIIRGLKEMPGRKSVLLMSDGLVLFKFGNEDRNLRLRIAVDRLNDLANRASVVIHTINTTGLQTLNFDAASSTPGMRPDQSAALLSGVRSLAFDNNEGLVYLSEATGGVAVRNTNDLAGGVRRAIEDQRGYYLIGYRPDETTFDRLSGRQKFHKFDVKVRRPGKFNVRMRKGFLGIPDEETPVVARDTKAKLLYALTSPFASAGVEMRLTSLYFNDPKLGSTMQSLLHIKASDLTFTPEPDGWQKSVIDLVAITFGDNGVPVDTLSHTHTLRMRGKALENAVRKGITYSIFVPIKKPGAYQLRTALRDVASDRIGSASQFVEVPDIKKKRLLLSGIVLRGVGLDKYQTANVSTPAQKQDEQTEDLDPLADAASRQFHHGLVMEYGVAVYNVQIDKASGKPKLVTQVRLFRNGKQVFAGKEIPYEGDYDSAARNLAVNGAIQLGTEMDPGEYVVQIVVRDLLAKEKHNVATQWIDFQVNSLAR